MTGIFGAAARTIPGKFVFLQPQKQSVAIMVFTIIVLIATVAMFIAGKMRSDIVALCSLVVLLLAGILTPAEAFAGFSSSVVIMMVGLFVVGGAIFQTGLAEAIGGKIMKFAGGSSTRLFLLVVTTTAIIGGFVSNTGTVALMMPIAVSVAMRSGIRPAFLLMPLAFASSMGGMLTLIGTPPNLVIQEALQGAGYKPLGFFSFLPVGLICIVIGILVMLPLCRLFFYRKKSGKKQAAGKGKTLDELAQEYRIKGGVSRFVVTNAAVGVKGKSVAELDLRNRYGISILEIRNESRGHGGLIKNVSQSIATPERVLQAGDIIYILGDKDSVSRFAADCGLEKAEGGGDVDFYDLGIAEIVLMPDSRIVGLTVRDSKFRELYSINVLGIRRGKDYITDDIPRQRLHAGDVLLVQGAWGNISRLADEEESDWVVIGNPEKQERLVILDYKAPLCAAIMILMVAAMVFDFIPVAPVTAVVTAALLMVVCGCYRSVDAAYGTINWQSIVLIAAMMPMAVALEKTGVSARISHTLVSALGAGGPVVLLGGLYFATSLLTMFISNTATAVLMAPIAMTASAEVGVSPYPFLFAVTLGASMCFASPFSTPPNALVMHAGEYTFGDYVRVGLPLQVILGIVMTLVLPLLFPF